MEPACVRCGYALRVAPASATPYGWMHLRCIDTTDARHDFLPATWIPLIYAPMLIPFVQPVALWIRRGLVLAWRDRYPNRVATMRFHGAIADVITMSVFFLAFVSLVLWGVWRLYP